jgi:hypothetical protein
MRRGIIGILILATVATASAAQPKKAPAQPPVFVPVPLPPPIVQTQPVDPNRTASTRFFSQPNGWQVRIDDSIDGGCFVMQNFDDGTVFRTGLNPKSGKPYLLIANPKWKSLEVGKQYRISVSFVDDKNPWVGDANAVPKLGFGPIPALLLVITDLEFLAEFGSRPSVDVRYGDNKMALLNLEGSGLALKEMIRCQKINGFGGDPFSKPEKRESKPVKDDPFAT